MFCTRDLTAIERPPAGTLPLLGISLRELNHGFPQLFHSKVPFPTPSSKAVLSAPGTQMPRLCQYARHGHMGMYGCTAPGHHPADTPPSAPRAQTALSNAATCGTPCPRPPRSLAPRSSSPPTAVSIRVRHNLVLPPDRRDGRLRSCPARRCVPSASPATSAHRARRQTGLTPRSRRQLTASALPAASSPFFPTGAPPSPLLSARNGTAAPQPATPCTAHRARLGRAGGQPPAAPLCPRSSPRDVSDPAAAQCPAAMSRSPGAAGTGHGPAAARRLEIRAAPVRARAAAEPRRRAARPALTGFFLRRLWSRLTTRSVYSTGFRVRERWGQP